MTAIAQDRSIDKAGSKLFAYDLAATAKLYQGTLIIRNAAGNLLDGANTVDTKFAGISRGDPVNGTSTVDNTNGSIADLTAELQTEGVFSFASSGLDKTDIGARVYVSDNQTITTTPGHVFCGIIVAIIDSKVYVDIVPATTETRERVYMYFSRDAVLGATAIQIARWKFNRLAYLRAVHINLSVAATTSLVVSISDGTTTLTAPTLTATEFDKEDYAGAAYLAATEITVTADDDSSASAEDLAGFAVFDLI